MGRPDREPVSAGPAAEQRARAQQPGISFAQVPSGHFLRLFLAQKFQNRRRDILQRSTWPQRRARFIHKNEWHRIRSVVGMWPFGDRIDEGLRIARRWEASRQWEKSR